MKMVKKSTENFHFYSREQSLYIAWACFRNVQIWLILDDIQQCRFQEIHVSVQNVILTIGTLISETMPFFSDIFQIIHCYFFVGKNVRIFCTKDSLLFFNTK